jgi:GR25 family glycosyltransferase involved in LPS biosynthesis
LINLDRSPDRLAEFTKINAHLSEFTPFSAVDGQTLDLGVLQGAGLVTWDVFATYSTSALGCAMSHIGL